MFLYYVKNNEMICDFQLIYDTDCKMQFDFYAYGLLREPSIFKVDAKCDIPRYGMFKIKKDDYDFIGELMKEYGNNNVILHGILNDIKSSIETVKFQNYKFEENMTKDSYDREQLKKVLDAMIEVMAFRRLADYAGNRLAECVRVEKHSKLGVPSYLLLLDEKRKQIITKKDVEIFVQEYAYLYSFNIRESEYEKIENYKYTKSEKAHLEPLNIPYDNSKCTSQEECLLYGFSWYNELRHIYQARTLRNIRTYLDAVGKDIYDTGMEELMGV